MSVIPPFLATGIGSMPYEDAERAVELSLRHFTEAPFWPQLQKLGLNEQMAPQYSEGIPRVRVDRERKRLVCDTSGDYSGDLSGFYEQYLLAMDPEGGTGDCGALAISPAFARGLHVFEEHLRRMEGRLPFVKVQTTGPCTFALSIPDQTDRAIFFHHEFRDVAVKAMAMKCRWQIQKFQPFARKVICFLDEPVLSAYGSSAYVGVSREDVIAALSEVIQAVHSEGAIAGVHCCGNTEWSILAEAGVDMINFDAFEFGETIAMYPDAIRAHLERGGMLAWGVVPTSEAIREQTVESLAAHLEEMMENLARKGISKELILESAAVTPSCGTGTMAPCDAEKVFEVTAALSRFLREKHRR